MTTIKSTCSRCGDVKLQPSDLALELDPAEDSGTYRFACPTCQQIQRRPANARVVSVLLATGVSYEVVRSDQITESEIAQFAEALGKDVDFVSLITSTT